jgi:low molecular weight phosphotyrosine protein phosphatase
MDQSNYDNIMNKNPGNGKAKVKLLGEFDPNGERIIEDPYYGGEV